MVQELTEQDVRAIAAYARIGLAEDEIAQMTLDLNAIITGLAPIAEFDLTGVEPTLHPVRGLTNIARSDEPTPGFSQAEALRNASRHKDGCFLVPAIARAREACFPETEEGER